MIASFLRNINVTSPIAGFALTVGLFATVSVGAKLAIEYVVNQTRSPSYWVEYEAVQPTTDWFAIGVAPTFYTRAIWHRKVSAAWTDILWCTPMSGDMAGRIVRYNSPNAGRRYQKKPGPVGIYDTDGNIVDGGLGGFWEWGGRLPAVPANCWAEHELTIFPSPFVEHDVPIPRGSDFHVGDRPEGPPRPPHGPPHRQRGEQ